MARDRSEARALSRLGILGGTFDPIHLGHLRTAEEIGQELDLQKVYLIPSASPPHRIQAPVASFSHRLNMVKVAVGNANLLEALDVENRRPGLSYSIETLREFRAVLSPEAEIFFILGADAFLEIKTWKDYRNLFDYAHFVIIQRAGFQPEGLDTLLRDLGADAMSSDRPLVFTAPSGNRIMLMAPTQMDISSTRIRELVARGRSVRFLVPESVRVYIRKNRLYSDYADH